MCILYNLLNYIFYNFLKAFEILFFISLSLITPTILSEMESFCKTTCKVFNIKHTIICLCLVFKVKLVLITKLCLRFTYSVHHFNYFSKKLGLIYKIINNLNRSLF